MLFLLAIPAVLFWRALYRKDRERADWFLILIAVVTLITQAIQLWTPLRYDLYAAWADSWIGNLSFLAGQLLLKSQPLKLITFASYDLCAPVMVGVFAIYLWSRSTREVTELVRIYGLMWLMLPAFYWVLPICGPRFAFPSFPQLPGAFPLGMIHIDAGPPNAMPSGHFASALLILWFLRYWKWGRVFGIAFVAFTGLGTLGTGEHYFVDLLAAVPFTVGIVYAGRLRCSPLERKPVGEPDAGIQEKSSKR